MPTRIDDRMKKETLPADIRYQNWERLPSNAWTEAWIRNQVMTALNDFVRTHPWCDQWQVVEKFEGSPGRAVDINRRRLDENGKVTRGSSNLPYPPNTLQSNRTPLLIMKVRRADKRIIFEYGISLPEGNETDSAWLGVLLRKMVISFEAKYLESKELLG